MSNCLNKSIPVFAKLAKELGEIKTQELADKYFSDSIPTYMEFIEKAKDDINIMSNADVKNDLGLSFKKEVTDTQLINLNKAISRKNNENFKNGINVIYRTISEKIGQSAMSLWKVRKVAGSLNIRAKLDRIITDNDAKNALSQTTSTLEDMLPKAGEQLGIEFSKNENSIIQERISELKKNQEGLKSKIGKVIDLNSFFNAPEGVDMGEAVFTKEMFDEANIQIQEQINRLQEQLKNSPKVSEQILTSSKFIDNLQKGGKNSTTSILNNIIKNSSVDSNEYKVAKVLLSIQDKNKTVSVSVVDKFDEENDGTEAYIINKDNKIMLSIENIDAYGDERFKQTFLHELIHSYTTAPFNMSDDKLNSVDKEFAEDISKLYKLALSNTKNKLLYGYKNEKEFISEILTNPSFRKDVESIRPGLLDKLFELISDWLGRKSILDKSEEVIYKYLQDIDKVKTYSNLTREERQEKQQKQNYKKSDKQIESPFEKQFVFFKRRIATLEKELALESKNSTKAAKLEERILALSTKLDKAYEEQDRQAFTELGMMALAEAEDYINKVEAVPSKANKDNLLYAVNILSVFDEYNDLKTKSGQLFERAFPLILSHNLKTINQFASEGFEITENMINAQVKDIGTFKSSVGALADLANYIGRTIGSLIKAAQNRASTANKLYKNEVQKHVDALTIYAKENGKTLEQVYDMFINETKDDIRLIQYEIYVDGEAVPNAEFDKIKSSKTLLDFYLFYQESLKNADSNLPYKVGKHHIPNIHKANSIVYDLTHVLAKHNVLYDQFKSNEELYADMVPQQYRNRLSKDKKSRDLGASLLDFVAYSNNYNELSKVLAEARLLQQQLKWVRLPSGEIKKREFTKSSQPNDRVFAEQTNLWKMINTVIDMQLKGHMTKKQGEIKGKKIYDAEGNEIGYEARYWSDVADVGLKYNSLLKIGLSPITAVTNILFGDISNVIEAVGGRYFGMKDLAVATNIFGANALTKDSLLFKYLERINPLQELDDYNLTDKVKLKKMSAQKLQEYMYSMQKKGELFLQSRTMLAVMLKEGYIDNSGKLTSEGEKMMKDEARVTQFSDKIQRINQLIHGRYSSREAAAMQQSVFYRLAMQFRKWMPSAIESRVGEKQYDNRLGMEIEGRYLTLARLVASKDVFNNLIKMSKGELSELEMYNMRKNLIELTLLAATLFAYLKLTEGDDEEDKKRRKNPYVKLGLTLLNRISGDLEFFYNPSNIVSLTSNSIPLASVAKDLIKTVGSLPSAFYYGDYEYKAGSLKGRNKFWANLTKITPGARPVQDVWKIINKNPLDF